MPAASSPPAFAFGRAAVFIGLVAASGASSQNSRPSEAATTRATDAADTRPATRPAAPPITRRVTLLPSARGGLPEHRFEFEASEPGYFTVWADGDGVPVTLAITDLAGNLVEADAHTGGLGVPFLRIRAAGALTVAVLVRSPSAAPCDVDLTTRFTRDPDDLDAREGAAIAAFKRTASMPKSDLVRRAAAVREARRTCAELAAEPRLEESLVIAQHLAATSGILPPKETKAYVAIAENAAARCAPRMHALRTEIRGRVPISFLNSGDVPAAETAFRAELADDPRRNPESASFATAWFLLGGAQTQLAGSGKGKAAQSWSVKAVASLSRAEERLSALLDPLFAEALATVRELLVDQLLKCDRIEDAVAAADRYEAALAGLPKPDAEKSGSAAHLRMKIAVARGRHRESLEFGETALRRFADLPGVASEKEVVRLQRIISAASCGDYEAVLDGIDELANDAEVLSGARAKPNMPFVTTAAALVAVGEAEKALSIYRARFEGGAPVAGGAPTSDDVLGALGAAYMVSDSACVARLADKLRTLATTEFHRAAAEFFLIGLLVVPAAGGGGADDPELNVRLGAFVDEYAESSDVSVKCVVAAAAGLLGSDDAQALLDRCRRAVETDPGATVMAPMVEALQCVVHLKRGDATAARADLRASLTDIRASGWGWCWGGPVRAGVAALLAARGGDPAQLAERIADIYDFAEDAVRMAPTNRSPRAAAAAIAKTWDATGILLDVSVPPEPGPARDAALARVFALGEGARAGTADAFVVRRSTAADPTRRKEASQTRSKILRASSLAAELHAKRAPDAEIVAALEAKERAEEELVVVLSKDAVAARAMAPITAASVAERLRPGDLLIGYLRPRLPGLTLEDLAASRTRDHYLAWTLEHDGRVELVDLGPGDVVDRAVAACRAAWLAPGGSVRGIDDVGAESRADADAAARRLAALILEPPLRRRPGAGRVILLPTADLHLVPFDALPSGAAGGLFGDGRELVVLTSVRDLSAPESDADPDFDGVVVGGVDYEASSAVAAPAPDPQALLAAAAALVPPAEMTTAMVVRDGGLDASFAALPGSLAEAEAVAAIVRGDDAGEARLLKGADATKAKFLATAGRSALLHVATHGWFAAESMGSLRTESRPNPAAALFGGGGGGAVGYSPFLLCGLAFAGANVADGDARARAILTAEELASLDLSACRLAVLSACQTGAGRRRGGGDLASLRQALHAAGVRRAVTSLWPVPDAATAALMTDFHRRHRADPSRPGRALADAKAALRAETDAASGRPRYAVRDWAAWVLTGPPDS